MLVKNSGIVVTSAPVSIVNDRGVSLTRTFYGGVMEDNQTVVLLLSSYLTHFGIQH